MTTPRSIRNALRSGAAIPAAALVTFAMVGCAGDGNESADTTPSSSASAPTDGQSSPQPPVSAGMPIVIEIDGIEIAGALDDSTVAASLLAQLPLTMTFSDYGGQEIIGELPEPLNLEGAPEGSAAPALTIGYYVPQQSLVFYYESVGYFGGIIPVGTFESSDDMENRAGEFTVAVRAR